MQLSNEQRELLSAYLDGEVNASEKALALALLEREEARAYVAGLKRLRELAQTHAGARAPRDFASLVRQSLDGDFDGISRPTSNQGDYDSISRPTSNQLQLNAMPQASWRMPLMAMAAAVVMAVGIFAVNSLMVPSDAPRDLSTAGRDFRKDPEAAPSSRVGGEQQPDLRESPVADPAGELARPAPNPPTKKPESAKTDKYERKNSTGGPADAAEDLNEEMKKGYSDKERGKDANTENDDHNSEREQSEKWSDDKKGEAGGVGGGAGGGGKSKTSPAEGGETVRRAREKSDGPEAGKKQEGSRNDGKAPAQPAPTLKDATSEVEVRFAGRDSASPTVATDVLAVASNFGEATASTNDDGTTVEVEVPEDQVEELLAAINKLAQSTAETARENNDEQPSKEADAPRARDYLPSKLRDAVERAAELRKEKALEEAKPPAPAEAPAAPAKKKVKVVVRLK